MGSKIDFSSKKDLSSTAAFAEMFKLNSSRTAENENIAEIDIDILIPFKGHPFKLYTGEKLDKLVESIKDNGVMSPITVRKKDDGTFEILSGHNRVNSAKLAGLTKIPAFIKENISDAEAKIIVTDSNFLQRSIDEMLPSELAKSLQMQLEACKEAKQKQAYINAIESDSNDDESKADKQGVQVGHPEKSRNVIAKNNKMSNTNIQRYLRLNYLNDDLLNLVDQGDIKLVPAVSISYLTSQEQNLLFNILSNNEYKINIKKADAMKERSGKLTKEDIEKIASGEFFETKRKPKLSVFTVKPKILSRFFTEYSTQTEIAATIEKALEEYFERKQAEQQDIEENEEVVEDEEN